MDHAVSVRENSCVYFGYLSQFKVLKAIRITTMTFMFKTADGIMRTLEIRHSEAFR